MKKIILLSVAILFSAYLTQAQSTFTKGDVVVNLGVGFGETLYKDGYSISIPPISLSAEYGVLSNLFNDGKGTLGVGVYTAYSKGTLINILLDDKAVANIFIVGARGALHYDFVKNLDTYAGVVLGYKGISTKINLQKLSPIKNSKGEFGYNIFVGGRYYFTDNIAAMAELGYGVSVLTIGVSYRF